MQQRQRNQRGAGSHLRTELIQAAMRILDRAPAAELSLRMVAREAGVAAPSVYSQFADAKTLLAEIVRECWSQLGDAMAETAQAAPADDAYAQLRSAMAAYVRYAMERPSRYQLLYALQPVETGQFPDLPGLLQPAYRNVLAKLQQLSAEGVALPARDAESATLLIISLTHGRIALAHLAPHRAGNSAAGVEAFVLDALGRLFAR
ncbi:TetR/AcrR family transcriptional regulator [Phenylobacterium sp. LjRoot219]|uniref:TetR/AcrR family transcriptional regulator n=1 Tax=Phenylobacterium sp. LjRoot219 TaxID=3342283 RepID=UPI003ECF0CD6